MTPLLLSLLLAGADAGPPRLGVVVVVDQLGSADLETLAALGLSDFGGLEARGARGFNAWYQTLSTETGPGHATLSTGALPSTHGICANEWFTDGGATYCVADPVAGRSARNLAVPTLGDTLKLRSPGSKVVSVSLKDRSAILLAGASADLVLWYEPSLGAFTTSAAWGTPVPSDLAAVARAPREAWARTAWSPLDGGVAAKVRDDRAGEVGAFGFNAVFPHDLSSLTPRDQPAAYRMVPQSMEDTFALALAALDAESLGRRGVTDLLFVSISTTDYAGHVWGPGSAEKLDLLQRTSRELERFVRALDQRLGRDGYVLTLTADHGAPPLPEQALALKLDAGRLQESTLVAAARAALPPAQQARVLGASPPHVFLDERGLNAADIASLRGAVLRGVGGVKGVLPVDQAAPVARASRFGDRCGTVTIDLAPYFVFNENGTTGGVNHASGNAYDRRVPLFVLGPGVRRGRSRHEAHPQDLAITLATLLGIPPPDRSEGHVLPLAD